MYFLVYTLHMHINVVLQHWTSSRILVNRFPHDERNPTGSTAGQSYLVMGR